VKIGAEARDDRPGWPRTTNGGPMIAGHGQTAIRPQEASSGVLRQRAAKRRCDANSMLKEEVGRRGCPGFPPKDRYDKVP
jgi:hypothetical protein